MRARSRTGTRTRASESTSSFYSFVVAAKSKSEENRINIRTKKWILKQKKNQKSQKWHKSFIRKKVLKVLYK